MANYRVGVKADGYHQIEVVVADEDYSATDWVSAAEYAIELVQSQYPKTNVELEYIKEWQ